MCFESKSGSDGGTMSSRLSIAILRFCIVICSILLTILIGYLVYEWIKEELTSWLDLLIYLFKLIL